MDSASCLFGGSPSEDSEHWADAVRERRRPRRLEAAGDEARALSITGGVSPFRRCSARLSTAGPVIGIGCARMADQTNDLLHGLRL
jgi:hypothetical protein